jgi:hypothetical protein
MYFSRSINDTPRALLTTADAVAVVTASAHLPGNATPTMVQPVTRVEVNTALLISFTETIPREVRLPCKH